MDESACCNKSLDLSKNPAVPCMGCDKPFHVRCMLGVAPNTQTPTLVRIAEVFLKNRTAFYCSDECRDGKEFKDANSIPQELDQNIAEIKEGVNFLMNFIGVKKDDPDDGFTTVISRKSKKTYAKATAPTNLGELIYRNAVAGVNNAPKLKEAEDKRLRTVVIEGLSPQNTEEDPLSGDDDSVKQILLQIGCDGIEIEGVERQRNQNERRPAVLKVFLRTKADRDFILRKKRNLKDSVQFKHCFIRPSLTEASRVRRDRLRQFAYSIARREKFANLKESPYRVLLNDFSEEYELRKQNSDKRIDWKSPQMEPSKEEWSAASEALDALWKAGNANRGGRRLS